MQRSQKFQLTFTADRQSTLCDGLAGRCEVSRTAIKDALAKGAVRIQRGNKPRRRVRKATYALRPGDRVEFFYDQTVLARNPPPLTLLHGDKRFSVWLKPAEMLSQGTAWGDHCALLRLADLHYRLEKRNYLIHRLDREVAGIILTAHDSQAAGKFSQLFRDNRIDKEYVGTVAGRLGEPGEAIDFSEAIDGRPALTKVRVLQAARDWTGIGITITTGRKHQIRRHLSGAGFPLLGDRRYGGPGIPPESGAGIALVASKLAFRCPFNDRLYTFQLPQQTLSFPFPGGKLQAMTQGNSAR